MTSVGDRTDLIPSLPVCRLKVMRRSSATQTLLFHPLGRSTKSWSVPHSSRRRSVTIKHPRPRFCVVGKHLQVCLVKKILKTGEKKERRKLKTLNTGTFFSQCSYLHRSRHICQRCKHRIKNRIEPLASAEGIYPLIRIGQERHWPLTGTDPGNQSG